MKFLYLSQYILKFKNYFLKNIVLYNILIIKRLCYLLIIYLIFSNNLLISTNSNDKQRIICDYCASIIKENYYTQNGMNYHPDCYSDNIQLKCSFCYKVISGVYNKDGGKNYHSDCYRFNILEKCVACNKPIETKYIVDNWDNKYHEFHLNDTPTCEACGRLICENITNGGITINTKRYICNLCSKSLIDNISNIEDIKERVLDILSDIGIIGLPKNIPIKLVHTKAELERMSKIRLGDVHGYTKYEIEKIGERKIGENFEIYILSYLHEIVFEAVLAHELMHVYLFNNDIILKSNKREGFCNLGSKLIYEFYNNNFSNLKLKSMANNNDPDYGKGYILMNSILEKNGWESFLLNLEKW